MKRKMWVPMLLVLLALMGASAIAPTAQAEEPQSASPSGIKIYADGMFEVIQLGETIYAGYDVVAAENALQQQGPAPYIDLRRHGKILAGVIRALQGNVTLPVTWFRWRGLEYYKVWDATKLTAGIPNAIFIDASLYPTTRVIYAKMIFVPNVLEGCKILQTAKEDYLRINIDETLDHSNCSPGVVQQKLARWANYDTLPLSVLFDMFPALRASWEHIMNRHGAPDMGDAQLDPAIALVGSYGGAHLGIVHLGEVNGEMVAQAFTPGSAYTPEMFNSLADTLAPLAIPDEEMALLDNNAPEPLDALEGSMEFAPMVTAEPGPVSPQPIPPQIRPTGGNSLVIGGIAGFALLLLFLAVLMAGRRRPL